MIRGDIEARNLDRIDVGLSVSRSARVETNMDAMHDGVHEEHLITLVVLHNLIQIQYYWIGLAQGRSHWAASACLLTWEL